MPRNKREKREEWKVNYRLAPNVKLAVSKSADIAGRSENLQAEYLLKIGYLHTRGVNTYGMSDLQIVEKFEDVAPIVEEDEADG
ncbi:hypothetical protein H6G91_17190 [Nostoc muscorum FACHB-395]|nr:hypothetical protein [Desmonostoc muscorum FACHB-395]